MDNICHCGARMMGSDHCPCCGCEEFEATCDATCGQPDTTCPIDHMDTCWERA